jgi:hypothetical protein
MRTLFSVGIAVAALFPALTGANGDSFDPKVPRERAWAKYHAITKEANGEERIATLMLKSLGKATADGKPCRWLESEYISSDGKRHERRKILIPEQAIESSLRPMDDVLRYLQQDDADAVSSVASESQGWMASDFLYFPGFLKDAKRVDDLRVVKYQGGSLEIPHAHVGTYRWWRKNKAPEETTVYETEYRVWLHGNLPLGVANAVTTLRLIRDGKTLRSWQLDYALQEFGDNAQPAIVEESAPAAMP